MVSDANRRGYQLLLDAFWDEARDHGLALPTDEAVSAASFCSARRKITPGLIKHMLHEIATHAFDGGKSVPCLWHGRRVYAVDGTKINLQRDPDLDQYFGTPEGAYCPQALVSVLLDVCAKLPVDVEVSPGHGNERELLLEMLPSLGRGDVLVLDRGYPSHEVAQALSQEGIDFLMRVPVAGTFAVIDELLESESSERSFLMVPPKGSPEDWRPLRLRAVRITSPDGTESCFITTLRRCKFSRKQLAELYHMRWDVEEFFKLAKGPYIGQGQLRSKSPAGVEQEIHALVLFLAITRLCMNGAANAAGRDYPSLSQKAAVLAMAHYLTRLLLAHDQKAALKALHALFQRIVRAREKPRPGRSFPRRSFRPRLRWGPNGRVGA